MVEGTVQGLACVALDAYHHPCETIMMAVAGREMLAYQVCKVLVNVAYIGITAIGDTDAAYEQWHDYIAPLTGIINAIDVKNMAVREVIKTSAAVLVGWKAQGKLLNGLSKLCHGVKGKALKYMSEYGALGPEQYMTTPEGELLKCLVGDQESNHITNAMSAGGDCAGQGGSGAPIKWALDKLPKLTKSFRPLVPTWVDCKALAKKFDGKIIEKGKPVAIDYEHQFSITEKILTKRSGHVTAPQLYGWHHDYMHGLVNRGIVAYENIIMGNGGAYKANVIINGVTYKEKTFFPSHWTESQVIEKIIEAYSNINDRSVRIDDQGCHIIEALITDGLTIRIIFDPIKSLITSAFPLIK